MCAGMGSVRLTKRVSPAVSRMVPPSSLSISRAILGLFGRDMTRFHLGGAPQRAAATLLACLDAYCTARGAGRWVIEVYDVTAADWIRLPEWELCVRTWVFPSPGRFLLFSCRVRVRVQVQVRVRVWVPGVRVELPRCLPFVRFGLCSRNLRIIGSGVPRCKCIVILPVYLGGCRVERDWSTT